MAVRIRMTCGRDGCRAPLRAELKPGTSDLSCPLCARVVRLTVPDALAAGRPIESCPRCGAAEFFVRKDFPQRIGLAIVVAAGLASCVLFYFDQLLWTWAVLGGAVLVDAALYGFTGIATVCYRCRAEFRGQAYNSAHEAFDLATSEKYSQVIE